MRLDARSLLVVFLALRVARSLRSRRPTSSANASSESEARSRVATVALGEVGQRDPLKYWRDVLPGLDDAQLAAYAETRDWCGGFALWCLREAGLAEDITWKDGKGFCYRLPQTTDPKPGDIAFFKALNHHAVVVAYDPASGIVETVDGNQGPLLHPDDPGSVRTAVARHRRKASSVTTFFSIAPLLGQKPIAVVTPIRRGGKA